MKSKDKLGINKFMIIIFIILGIIIALLLISVGTLNSDQIVSSEVPFTQVQYFT
jgi:hypothetical protein